MPNDLVQLRLLPPDPVAEIPIPQYVRISARTLNVEIDCTVHGITREGGCSASCCKGFTFWPPRASGTGTCANLGPQGCTLGDDKPVTCLLYPFRLRGNSLVLFIYSTTPTGTCRPCYKRGGQTIGETNRRNLELLFGEKQTELILENAKKGLDTIIKVPDETRAQWEAERTWEKANLTPLGRSKMEKKP